MSKQKLYFGFLVALIFPNTLFAKVCTFQDIQSAINSGKNFIFSEAGCTNSKIMANDILHIQTNGMEINGKGKPGQPNLELEWDGKNLPSKYLTYSDHFTKTHNLCAPEPGSPWAIFWVDANNVKIKNLKLTRIPDGIHVTKAIGTVIEGNTFNTVCEDAITVRAWGDPFSVDKTTIRNNTFIGGKDKIINNEQGRILIEGNTFKDSNKAIDSGNDDRFVEKNRGFVYVKNNLFVGVTLPIRGSDLGWVVSHNNRFIGGSDSVFAARASGIVRSYEDDIDGSCDYVVEFSTNSRDDRNKAEGTLQYKGDGKFMYNKKPNECGRLKTGKGVVVDTESAFPLAAMDNFFNLNWYNMDGYSIYNPNGPMRIDNGPIVKSLPPKTVTKVTPGPSLAPSPSLTPRPWTSKPTVKVLPMFRLYHPKTGEHFMTTSQTEGTQYGFKLEGTAFRFINQSGGVATHPIYRCYVKGKKHFISRDSNCEGQVTEGMYGYVYSSMGQGTAPLYRFYNSKNGDHLITKSKNEGLLNGYRLESILGYVL